MQLRKTVWMLTALSALSLVMTGCPEGEEGEVTCTTAADCTDTETCHPTAQVCVTKCTIRADCPDTEAKCEPLAGSTDSVCQCQTDELCNPGGGTEMVCSNLDKRCVARCTSDASCDAGQTCNTTSGQCEGGSTGDTCTGTSQSTCAYGEFCSNTKCEPAPVAPTTCENFPANDRPAWSATSGPQGPVIYDVGFVAYEVNSTNCTSGDAFIVRVKAYRTDADWPDNRSLISGFFYVRTDTTELDIIDLHLLVPNTGYERNPANPKDAEFMIYHCREPNSTRIQVGYYFTGGNPVCADIVKP
ncbi:MAG: hypothetical protein JXB05_34325 [Myxococcaceae bacterium]|nr:hypothetical protein [Myxococcaceae bacterium]